jgi:hypothetical protein
MVVLPVELKVVKAPVVGVVAPTVPLMLIDAVPVRLVTVPLEGVPKAPLNNTGAPAEPVLTARAVATPVPRPDTPVAIGRPVAFVKVAAEGVPKSGVTKAGDVANTADPVPVSSVKAERRLALEGVAKKVATPVAKPLIPVLTGKPVALVKVAEAGVPRVGVTKVGELANTKAPEPVSSDIAEARLADDGVPRNVATPLPRPETPVEIGKPVKLVATPEAGVPNAGVTSVGEFDNTTEPVPVELVTPVPPLATGRVPVMSAVERVTASQVAFVPSVCRYLFALPVWLGNRLFKAAVAVEAPVPPSATAKSVIPVIEPPVIAAAELSVFVDIAVEMLLNSVSISVPRTILSGSPGLRLSLVAKLVLFV